MISIFGVGINKGVEMTHAHSTMYVIKRAGFRQAFDANKLLKRLKTICGTLCTQHVDTSLLLQKISDGLCANILTTELDTFAAETCASMLIDHPKYGVLAAHLMVSKWHKDTPDSFVQGMTELHQHGKISEPFFQRVLKHSKVLESAINHYRDYYFNYFGLKTLEKSYVLKINGRVVERPQYLWMRVALQLHGDDLTKVLDTYNLLSLKYFIHATPTLFHAGTPHPQLSSCFLMTLQGIIQEVYHSIGQCALISSRAGGIGLAVHDLDHTLPLVRVLNATARYAEQGHSQRPGAMAIYLEPWHCDMVQFLNLKKNTGHEEERARDLFYALWIPDLFMERVEKNETWSLMHPHTCPGLSECWGEAFNTLYETYEKEEKFVQQVPAQTLWRAIVDAQIETGTPFMLYKDACNAKSNQKQLGTLRCSNLCTEIVQYTSKDEIAVCNLASIALNSCVYNQTFNFQLLKTLAKKVTYNLNQCIDQTCYPVEEARVSNTRHRPLGLGVQGLADTFFLMRYPFESPEARTLNIQIFETLYYGALEASCELAQLDGPYESFADSPSAQGLLQFDVWQVTPSKLWDWDRLKANIAKYGLRNSLCIALMPTASTAQILGNHESIEAWTSNLYTRRVLSGEFQIINPYLVQDLIALQLWNDRIKQHILAHYGSIQQIPEIPEEVKRLYKTVWEISQKTIIDMAVDRAPYVDQSQSLNIYMENPTYAKLSSMHFYGWKKGLKTGMYYLRSKAAAQAIQFTVEKDCTSCSA